MLNVELEVIGGKHSGQVIKLSAKKFLIGREQDCHLRPNSELVSRHHCIFTVDDFSVRLRDLGSTNGTLINGERIRKETVLQAGDKVTVGSLEFAMRIREGAVEETTTIAASTEDSVIAPGDATQAMPVIPAPAAATSAEPPPAPAEAVTTPADQMPPTAENEAPVEPTPETTQTAAIAATGTPTPGEIPQVGTGDTTVIPQQMMMPNQQMYQPMMPQQQMGYPQPYQQQYPFGMPQQMPMYPQQQPGYPQAYPQPMPQQLMPQQPMPAQPAVAPEPTPSSASAGPEVSLPDPATTGAKEDPPPPPAKEGEAAASSEKSNESAAAIIKQHMQRRPGG